MNTTILPLDVPAPALTLAQAKQWLRVVGESENELIDELVVAATTQVEDYTGRTIMESSFQANFNNWPVAPVNRRWFNSVWFPAFKTYSAQQCVVLPRCPLVSVESVSYRDVNGDIVEIDEENYHVSVGSAPSLLIFKEDFDLPELIDLEQPDNVQIVFSAGHTDTDVAKRQMSQLRMAVRYLLTHYYDFRSSLVVSATVSELPYSIKNLLRALRVDRPFDQ